MDLEAERRAAIRPAIVADEDAVWRLVQQLATSYVPERAAFARSFIRLLSDPAAAVLVVEDADSLVVGYVHVLVHPALHANGDVAWVEELVVDSTHRRLGLGRSLLGAAERWAAESGHAAHLALASRRAGNFYLSVGYEESATYFKRRLSPLATQRGGPTA